jgi:hypothetical protein
VSQTLHGVLEEVLLYIGSAMALLVGCQPEDTCYQCCFALTGRMCFVGVVAASAAATETPAFADCSSAHVGCSSSICCCMTYDL